MQDDAPYKRGAPKYQSPAFYEPVVSADADGVALSISHKHLATSNEEVTPLIITEENVNRYFEIQYIHF